MVASAPVTESADVAAYRRHLRVPPSMPLPKGVRVQLPPGALEEAEKKAKGEEPGKKGK